jgi:hypothetical protein
MIDRNGKHNLDVDQSTGLNALAWALGEPDRAQRLLALTGLEPAELRARATDPALLAAILAFLEAHEPDLIACADALDMKPAALVAARMRLER